MTTAPDLLLLNANVLTLDATDTRSGAVAVTDGRISALGTTDELSALAGESTTVVNLKGNTVVPGFIDAHSHVSMGAPFIHHAALLTPPVGSVRTVDDVLAALHENVERNKPAAGDYVIGWGYYPDAMEDGGALTAEILDREFPDHRVAIVHVSAHGGVVNSKVLTDLGFDASTPDPEGGTIVRKGDSDEPNGVLWEQAWMPLVFSLLDYGRDEFEAMLAEYARWGVTTVQDGAATWDQVMRIRSWAAERPLSLDVRSLAIYHELDTMIESGLYASTVGGHTIQGLKLILDGSPQGRTANVTEEYREGGPDGQHHWHGLAVMPQDEVDSTVARAMESGVQIYAHVNGDGAIDSLVGAHQRAAVTGLAPQAPSIAIHSQVMRVEQLDAYVAAGIQPSMFTVHTYLFGDTHIKNFGLERASGISPMTSAMDRGLRPTNHSDYPVTPINPMMLLWSSVSRRTIAGVVLGEDQQVSPLDGLRALTSNVAFQYGIEDEVGTIEVGKYADLAVLSADPLTVEADAIKEIKVVQTLRHGEKVYEDR